MLERILKDYGTSYGIKSAWLRYFNACGAAADGVIGEDHDPETHLIPCVLMTLTGEREKVTVFGTDYDTPDGTCIRDYIHILDLARAHVLALKHLEAGGKTFACNLGTGQGVSVQEIIDKAEKVTGQKIPVEYGDRRAGDPSALVADPALAKELLGWEAEYKDVTASLETAWAWMSQDHRGRYPRS
jgi:UDP-glucose 4-epimerase